MEDLETALEMVLGWYQVSIYISETKDLSASADRQTAPMGSDLDFRRCALLSGKSSDLWPGYKKKYRETKSFHLSVEAESVRKTKL